VPLVEQELLTLPKHMSSPPVFSGAHVTRLLVLCVCFVDRCLSFFPFFFWPLYCLPFFDLRILITSLWYLHTLLMYFYPLVAVNILIISVKSKVCILLKQQQI